MSSFRKILLSLCLALCSFKTKRALNTSSRIDSLENFTMIGRVCWSPRLSTLGPSRWHFTMVWRCSCGFMAIVVFTKFSTAVVTSSVSLVSGMPLILRFWRREYCSWQSMALSRVWTFCSSSLIRVCLLFSKVVRLVMCMFMASILSANVWGKSTCLSFFSTCSSFKRSSNMIAVIELA